MSKEKSRASTLKPTLTVVMESEVARQVRQHGRSSPGTEVCGVLIGKEEGSTTVVETCIAGANAAQGGAHVTFTQDTWEHIYKIKDREYPDARIVGWYHSHPGFGVFLSDHDLFIHQNFFSAAQQIAWVYDPQSDEEGCFGWHDGKIQKIDNVAFRFGQPCGEIVAASTGDDESKKVKNTRPDGGSDWISVVRTIAIHLFFFLLGAAGVFYFITSKAILLPRGEGMALVLINDNKIAVIPPEITRQILTMLQSEADAQFKSKQPLPDAAGSGAGTNKPQEGEPNGRKK